MERTTIEKAKDLFGSNFIGLKELQPLFDRMGIEVNSMDIPDISYSLAELEARSQDYILILGISEIKNKKLTIQTFRECFGVSPEISEPCFYNQDWYLREDFMQRALANRWFFLRKNVLERTRAEQPVNLLKLNMNFPSAILCVYTFYAYYYANNEILWCHDFVWCDDTDHNGDRIYVGKYHDIDGVNKNGFSIHRHLGLRKCYGAIDC